MVESCVEGYDFEEIWAGKGGVDENCVEEGCVVKS